MTVFYLDTFALLKRYQNEKGTEVIDELFEDQRYSELFTTSYFTVLEVTSVATRLLKTDAISKRTYNRLLGTFTQDISQLFALQPVFDFTLSEAIDLITEYALRAPDAIQLASALVTRSNLPAQSIYFLCSDAKLISACISCGLLVLNPEAEDSIDAIKKLRDSEKST